MRQRTLGFAAMALATVLTVAACSSGGSNASSPGRSALLDANSAGGKAAGPEPAPASLSGSGSGGDAAVPIASDDALSAKIRTAQITVAVAKAAQVRARATKAAALAAAAGGEVDSDDRTSGPHASATMQLRVPPEALGQTLDALSALGAERSRQLSTVDVSEKVADVSSRVLSAREAIARLRALYASATKVADVISIETELSGREADLESLQAQQRTLARQTSMATITLTLVTAPKAAAAKPSHKNAGGFLGGLERGWNGFTDAAAWVAGALGAALPFLLLALLLGLGVRVARRRLPPRPSPTPSPAE